MISLPVFCLLLLSFRTLAVAAFNPSEVLASASQANESSSEAFPSSHFLKDVLKFISLKQSWNLDEIRVSNSYVGKARVGSAQRYEFRLRVGKSDLLLEFPDEVHSWRKIRKRGEFNSLVNEVSSESVLNAFKLEGPFELIVDGDDDLTLVLPGRVDAESAHSIVGHWSWANQLAAHCSLLDTVHMNSTAACLRSSRCFLKIH